MSQTEVAVGLAGVGYWGAKLARNLQEIGSCRFVAVADPDDTRAMDVAGRYPDARPFGSLDDMLESDEIEAVVLATPAAEHHRHVVKALAAGKHVFVEKPLALSSLDGEELVAAAERAGRTLMVGHTFLYSEPVRLLRQLIQDGELGCPLYVYGSRLNLGVIREDLNAWWNFGPHDVAILLHLLGEVPVSVSARQFNLLDRRLQDVAFVVLEFPSGVVGHIHTSWLDPRKVRQMTVVGRDKMAVYDDMDTESPLRIYDKGVTQFSDTIDVDALAAPAGRESFGEFKLRVRAGGMVAPRVEPREPLRTEIEHFLDCVRTGGRPLTDGRHGLDVVRVLEAAERSAAENGAAVPVAGTTVLTP